ncbi:MAG: hypothetical protein LBN05_02085 [Oscillospiraceae bacterium]|jgi:chromosome segregation ATPase|nr:hypothetical protein [Oscillospiraceae bacterium]
MENNTSNAPIERIRQLPEVQAIATYLRSMEFRKKLFGLDRESVLDHILAVTEKYDAIIAELFAKQDAQLQDIAALQTLLERPAAAQNPNAQALYEAKIGEWQSAFQRQKELLTEQNQTIQQLKDALAQRPQEFPQDYAAVLATLRKQSTQLSDALTRLEQRRQQEQENENTIQSLTAENVRLVDAQSTLHSALEDANRRADAYAALYQDALASAQRLADEMRRKSAEFAAPIVHDAEPPGEDAPVEIVETIPAVAADPPPPTESYTPQEWDAVMAEADKMLYDMQALGV